MSAKSNLADLVRHHRERLQLTQQQLAERAGFSALQIISDIERGKRDVKAWELVHLAAALHTSSDVLLGLRQLGAPRVVWRRGSPCRSATREAQLLERARRYRQLEEWCDICLSKDLPNYDLMPVSASYSDATRIADQVRGLLELGSRPAASLTAVLEEDFGVKIFYEDLDGDQSAASVRGDFGAAVLMDSSEAPWRRNFSFGHELFHLVTWDAVEKTWQPDGGEADEPKWLDRVESLANAFSAHLLLPADQVALQFDSRFPAETVSDSDHWDLIELAREFGVSTSALVWRLVFLKRLTQQEAEELLANEEFIRKDKRSMVGRWYSPDPLPDRYRRLAVLAYEKGSLSRARLAEFLEVGLGELTEMGLDDNGGQAEAATSGR